MDAEVTGTVVVGVRPPPVRTPVAAPVAAAAAVPS